MEIIKFIKNKYNFSGETIYRDRNKYTIGTHRVILKSISTKIDNNIILTLNKILDYSDRLEVINPLVPIQFTVESHCKYIGKTAAETKFWQNTGATIVAIKRGDELIISPGPYITFMENDIILAVGDRYIFNSVPSFLYD